MTDDLTRILVEIAAASGVSAPQVRRDLMVVGCMGSPNKGYSIQELSKSLDDFLYAAEEHNAVLVGVGNLGRAVLSYFSGQNSRLNFVAAFDNNPAKSDCVIHGCRCHQLRDLPEIVRQQKIWVGVIAAPAAAAQQIADMLVENGVRGLLNFAPVCLRVPKEVYVESVDMMVALEKVAYFARKNAALDAAKEIPLSLKG